MSKASLPPVELLKKLEVARILGISVQTVVRMTESGRLPEPLRLSAKTIRWRRADIEVWIAGGCQPLADVGENQEVA